MIYIRDDDVLVRSRRYDPLSQFKKVHEIICSNEQFLHVAAILTTEIREFPDAVQYIREEVEGGRMLAEIHGFQHIDYGKLSPDETARHLAECIAFHTESFGSRPTKFFTPWGVSTPGISLACETLDLEMVDDSAKKLGGKAGLYREVKAGLRPAVQEILIHWWNDTDKLEYVMKEWR